MYHIWNLSTFIFYRFQTKNAVIIMFPRYRFLLLAINNFHTFQWNFSKTIFSMKVISKLKESHQHALRLLLPRFMKFLSAEIFNSAQKVGLSGGKEDSCQILETNGKLEVFLGFIALGRGSLWFHMVPYGTSWFIYK